MHPPPAPRPANEARVRGKDDLSDTVDFEFTTQFLYFYNIDRSLDLYDGLRMKYSSSTFPASQQSF